MAESRLDRKLLRFYPLRERVNRAFIERDAVPVDAAPAALDENAAAVVAETAARMRAARAAGRPCILAFGAHAIKNGLGAVLIELMERGWLTHLATNGAGIIHDWEFAFQGESSEHVEANAAEGKFGMWEETGRYLNLAIAVGAYAGLGYGASVGRFVEEGHLDVPAPEVLREEVSACLADGNHAGAAAAAALLDAITRCIAAPGRVEVSYPYKQYGVQAAAWRLGVPFTGHPMFGHDIIYAHPMCHGASIGRAAERDFLSFAASVSRIEGGVYLSVGSAVMSPMIFEKSLSMARNLAVQQGESITRHFMAVVDLQRSEWDWSSGEPPESHPDYYLRFMKTFHRMGGTLRYAGADNRDFLLGLLRALRDG